MPVTPEPRNSRLTERSWTFIIIGVALLLTLFSVMRSGPVKPKAPPPVPQLASAMVPMITGQEPVPRMFVKAGCPVCHTIPGVPGADGRVGPKLVLGTTGPQRLADPGYRGDAKTVREYVIESILKPGAYVVPGYPDRAMPRWYGEKISAGALESMAAYLERQVEE
jgi:hypothetical protein